MKEISKDIPDYEGLYQVSNFGRVKSLDRRIYRKDAHGGMAEFYYRGHILCLNNGPQGYKTVPLGHAQFKRVHRLVAQAFIPNPDDKPMVNHKDGNKSNNTVANLEWCTAEENMRHASKILKCNFGKYQSKQIRCVETGEIFENSIHAANGNKTIANRIRAVANHYPRRKTCCGFHWEFL